MGAPNFDLSGRVALITGSARGIGLAIAEALASQKCAVAVHDLDRDAASGAVEQIKREGGKAIALGGDITDLSIAPTLVRETIAQLGRIDILVNNASVQATLPWTQVDEKDFDRTMHANVLMALLLCQQVEPHLRRQKWGRIVNVGSVQQILGNERMMSYAMSKAALLNMTLALSRDLAADGITVNLIAPGYFNTVRNEKQLGDPEKRREAGERLVPVGRIGEPRDVAGLALLLCSEAGSYITGESIFVDGGMSARSELRAGR